MRLPEQRLYIGGEYQDASSGETFDTINPATGQVICAVQHAGPGDVDRAVGSAREGFLIWREMSGAERGRILNKAAALLRKYNDDLARLEVLDTGKPLQEAIAVDVLSGADAVEYYAGIAASIHGETFQLADSWVYTRREPLGVCVGIGAWNYPVQIACWKSAPALACGNSMVF
ncbi:MAG: aldehyde dehydrogenase family protein, partial [Acidimicrobiia bacterium]